MKVVRVVAIVLVTGVACAVFLASVAGYSGFQTWAVRRALANHPGLGASVRSVAANSGALRIRGLRLERNGSVLDMPSLDSDLPVIPVVLWRRVAIQRLVAKGWVLDLTKAEWGAAAGPASAFAGTGAVSAQAARAFQGIFANLTLPFDFSVDEIELEGDLIVPRPQAVPSAPLTIHVVFNGGGLAAGRAGRFTFSASAASAGQPVKSIVLSGTLDATMGTARSFTRASARVRAAAKGPKFPDGVRLSADLAASRVPSGESYTLALTGETKQLASVAAEFSRGTGRVSGTWKLDVRDDDLGPFAFGRPLPLFDLEGSGHFDSDASLAQAQVSGSLDATVDRLAAVGPKFSAIGAVKLTADFDLTRRGALYRVDHLRAAVTGAQPVLTVQCLQAFAFNAGTGELQVADAARDLVGVTLQGLPLEWAQPFLPGLELSGNPVHGELVALAGGGGLALRTRTPLEFTGLSIARNGRPVASDVELQLEFAADYTPGGWQIEVSRCAATGPAPGSGPRAEGRPELRSSLFTLSGKCGQLAGPGQPIKLAGRLDAGLPVFLAQPGIASMLRPGAGSALASGKLACDFSANLAERRSVEMRLACSNLVLGGPVETRSAESGEGWEGPVPLADLTANARFEIGADGRVAVSLPVVFQKDGLKSDATLTGTVFMEGREVMIEGALGSTRIVAEDLAPLVGLFGPAESGPAGAQGSAAPQSEHKPGAAPPWAGLGGQLKVALARVECAGTAFSDVSGTLRADASALQIDGLHFRFEEGGDTRANGVLAFAPGAPRPYSIRADVAIDDFNPAPAFTAVNPTAPPTVEGKFDVTAHLVGDGADLADLASRIRGDCQATSKGGVFRALSTSVAPKPGNVGTIGAAVAYLGSVTSAITGRKDTGDMSSPAQAVIGFAKSLSPIQYDQMSIVLVRDETLDTTLSDFTLINPEMRLGGSGRLSNKEGLPMLAQPLSMDFRLHAQGHQAELLKFLGALDPKRPDDLGYLPCTVPIHIDGTLARPDQGQFDAALGKLAVEKSGAGDLLNKLLGK
jgi:hypothetical protein